MKRFALALPMVFALTACEAPSTAPINVRGSSAGLPVSEFVLLRASQAAMADVLAQECPVYRYDEAAEDRLFEQTVEDMADVATESEIRRALAIASKRVRSSAQPTVIAYINSTGTDFSNPASVCRTARREVRERTVIGSMLRKVR